MTEPTKNQLGVGTIIFPDGRSLRWDFEEHMPYEPAAYHWDDGIIVTGADGESYFISLNDGIVYGNDGDDALTRVIEGAYSPEVKTWITRRDRELERMVDFDD